MNLQQAQKLLSENRYNKLANLYEQAISEQPDIISHHWHLGLAYLLQGQEEAAQATWMLTIAQGSDEETEQWVEELIQILNTEAQRQLELKDLQVSWLIRQHIREIAPTFLNNLLHLIEITIDLNNFTPDQLQEWEAVLNLETTSELDSELLLQVLKKLLEFPSPQTLAFAQACLPYYAENPPAFINTVLTVAVKHAYQNQRPDFAADLAELCLKLHSEHSEVLKQLSCFYSNAGCHEKAIATAKQFFNNCNTTPWQVQGSYLILRSLLESGSWLEVEPVAQLHKSLLKDLIQNPPETLDPNFATWIFSANFFLPYLQDNPEENHWLQNQTAQLLQKSLQSANSALVELPWTNKREKTRPLKIGYITHNLSGHSVGWLSRWLFKYHNRELFQTHLYLICQNLENHQWFQELVDFAYSFDAEPQATATQIKKDEIDILVDLDSLTFDITCKVMALKPAPIQVTWLGWDASGIPAIDYFIADSYVLPENAQSYYSEKIWRLPQTYIAVDGFEVGVPTLRREDLDIPADAVIYFSGQTGIKRHPNTVRLQMQILKQVPNSYFLVKGKADDATIEQFFKQIAVDEGIDPERLRFLPRDINEFVHRANLAIADVVLDTYPYNGATTTLETLWMGIPLVTRVGQQFAARNSYAFLKNVGVEEGIAWTDEEYIEWGVRLGKDAALRQQVAWKLKASRQTSPLWNGKQFTREMETAFQQMWQRYVEDVR